MIYRKALFVVAFAMTLACLPSANAEIVQMADASYAQGYYPCSDSDLINDGSPYLLSESRDTDCWFGTGIYTVPWANDGNIPTDEGNNEGEWYLDDNGINDAHLLPVAMTFMLDTTTNTYGYDITEVDSFSGWTTAWTSIAHQKFGLEMSKVNDDSWFSLGVYTWTPFTWEDVRIATSLVVNLTNDIGGALDNGTYTASNIDGIRITYMEHGVNSAHLTGTVVQEIDVIGEASMTPPPTPDIPGDANRDGKVDGSDVTILAGNWQVGVDDGQTAYWEMGDFNGDGRVDGSDVTILAGNWQAGVDTSASSVPEPSTAALIFFGLATLAGFVRLPKRRS